MATVYILAIDLAKRSFQVCAKDRGGAVLFDRVLSRARLQQLLSEHSPCIMRLFDEIEDVVVPVVHLDDAPATSEGLGEGGNPVDFFNSLLDEEFPHRNARGRLRDIYQQQKPPSTRRSTPVTKLAASDSRKTAGPTISLTSAIRCIGVCSSKSFV